MRIRDWSSDVCSSDLCDQFLVADLSPDFGQKQFASLVEYLFRQFVKRAFERLFAWHGPIVAEMMFFQPALSRNEAGAAARTDTIACEAGNDLTDVDNEAVGTLAISKANILTSRRPRHCTGRKNTRQSSIITKRTNSSK